MRASAGYRDDLDPQTLAALLADPDPVVARRARWCRARQEFTVSSGEPA